MIVEIWMSKVMENFQSYIIIITVVRSDQGIFRK